MKKESAVKLLRSVTCICEEASLTGSMKTAGELLRQQYNQVRELALNENWIEDPSLAIEVTAEMVEHCKTVDAVGVAARLLLGQLVDRCSRHWDDDEDYEDEDEDDEDED